MLAASSSVVHRDELESYLDLGTRFFTCFPVKDREIVFQKLGQTIHALVNKWKSDGSDTKNLPALQNTSLVARDGSGNFAAGTITASLNGVACLDLVKSGGAMLGPIQIPSDKTPPEQLRVGVCDIGQSIGRSQVVSISPPAYEEPDEPPPAYSVE